MRSTWPILALALLVFSGCDRGTEQESGGGETPAAESDGGSAPAPQQGEQPTPVTPTPQQQTAQTPSPNSAAGTGQGTQSLGTRANGYFESPRFNVRFQIPADWQQVPSTTEDSLMFEGPAGIQMVVANSESIQLVDANFSMLNDRVSFESVNVLPDRSEARPLNGLPGYRVEGDALLRGQGMPIYFISQAVNVPGQPVMATIFIPGDNYFEHSDAMKAVLDSIEALNLRPE